MNYSLSKKKAKELVEAKLSHFMGGSRSPSLRAYGTARTATGTSSMLPLRSNFS